MLIRVQGPTYFSQNDETVQQLTTPFRSFACMASNPRKLPLPLVPSHCIRSSSVLILVRARGRLWISNCRLAEWRSGKYLVYRAASRMVSKRLAEVHAAVRHVRYLISTHSRHHGVHSRCGCGAGFDVLDESFKTGQSHRGGLHRPSFPAIAPTCRRSAAPPSRIVSLTGCQVQATRWRQPSGRACGR